MRWISRPGRDGQIPGQLYDLHLLPKEMELFIYFIILFGASASQFPNTFCSTAPAREILALGKPPYPPQEVACQSTQETPWRQYAMTAAKAEPRGLVLAAPANWTPAHKAALKEAAVIAGFPASKVHSACHTPPEVVAI